MSKLSEISKGEKEKILKNYGAMELRPKEEILSIEIITQIQVIKTPCKGIPVTGPVHIGNPDDEEKLEQLIEESYYQRLYIKKYSS